MHIKIAMNIISIGFGLVRFRIKGVWTSEGPVYLEVRLYMHITLKPTLNWL